MKLHEFLLNFPNRLVANYVRFITLPFGRFLRPPSDRLMSEICNMMLEPNEVRDRFKQCVAGIGNENSLLGHIEAVFTEVIAAIPIEKRVIAAQRQGQIFGKDFAELVDAACKAGVITQDELRQLLSMDEARMSVINVDDFAPEEMTVKG